MKKANFIISPPMALPLQCIIITVTSLKLSTLGKKIQQTTFCNVFLIFPRKQDLTFHANCLHWRQFA